jgi:hypothetical protein
MRRAAPVFLLCVVGLASLAGASCSKPSESTDAKRSPRPPPSETQAIPSALHVDVEIDGAPAAAIDGARLAAIKPDFANDEHRVWRLATLVGPAAARAGAVVSAVGDNGVTLQMPVPASSSDPLPTLALNRRGDAVVGLVDPADPFPGYHGRGGRLNRPGDRLPRLYGPTRIRVTAPSDAH